MSKPMDNKESRKYLAAFADGELDVEQNLRVLEHIAMNPDATRRVMHQQQLRQSVRRSMRAQAPATPQALRDQITGMAAGSRLDPAGSPDDAVLSRIGRWLPTAVAAILLLAAILVATSVIAARRHGDFSGPLDARTVLAFQQRHVECASMPGRLQGAENSRSNWWRYPMQSRHTLASRSWQISTLPSLATSFMPRVNATCPASRRCT